MKLNRYLNKYAKLVELELRRYAGNGMRFLCVLWVSLVRWVIATALAQGASMKISPRTDDAEDNSQVTKIQKPKKFMKAARFCRKRQGPPPFYPYFVLVVKT